MPFVDPQSVHNPSAGTVAPASWGDTVRGSLVFLSSPPRGVVSHNTTTNHNSSGSYMVLPCNTETKDTDGFHDPVTNNSRVTIGVAGDYLFEAVCEFGASATGTRSVKFRKNATTDYDGSSFAGTSVAARAVVTALITGLVATDYIEAFAFQNSGGTITMQCVRLSWLYVGT